MPQKDLRSDNTVTMSETGEEMKKIARFLRLLTWQVFFLLALLLFLALRPQAGRYQFTVVGDDVGVFDTSNSQAWMIKLQKKSVTSGDQLGKGVTPEEGHPTEGAKP